jgi:hypothetical protein
MHTPVNDVTLARVSRSSLGRLGPLRCEPGVEVAPVGDVCWLRWEPGTDRVLRAVMPLPGAELFAFRRGQWRRLGQSVPAFDVPDGLDYQPLSHILFPAPVVPIPPRPGALRPAALRLVPDATMRPTTALLADIDNVATWADGVPDVRLAALRGAVRGTRLLLVGSRLPTIAGDERFWGGRVLVPLGLRPDPALPESALREVAGIGDEELLILRPDGCTAMPAAALVPLSRAGLRLAAREGRP